MVDSLVNDVRIKITSESSFNICYVTRMKNGFSINQNKITKFIALQDSGANQSNSLESISFLSGEGVEEEEEEEEEGREKKRGMMRVSRRGLRREGDEEEVEGEEEGKDEGEWEGTT